MCEGYEYEEDFDAESILDEEVEEGIDSIMGNLSVNSGGGGGDSSCSSGNWNGNSIPMGLGFCGKFGRGVRALRHVEEVNWWSFPIVDVRQISPKFHKPSTSSSSSPMVAEKKKKKKKVEKLANLENKELVAKENSNSLETPKPNSGLLLKLNFDEVLNSWSDRGSPFSDEISGSEVAGNDVSVCFSSPASKPHFQQYLNIS